MIGCRTIIFVDFENLARKKIKRRKGACGAVVGGFLYRKRSFKCMKIDIASFLVAEEKSIGRRGV